MGSETKYSRVWIRFESKKKDGETIKLRIQDLPSNRLDDYVTFSTTYVIQNDAIHKAAGIAKNDQAIEEYKKTLISMFGPPEIISICCLDDDKEDFDKILAVSSIHLTSKDFAVEDVFNEQSMETEEMKALVRFFTVMEPMFPKSLMEKYQNFYEGTGIIVHPDFQELGITSQFLKQRRLLLQENKVPMTCEWMTSIGSQKAAEKDGWDTVAEVTVEELNERTGLVLEKDVPTFKLMVATLD